MAAESITTFAEDFIGSLLVEIVIVLAVYTAFAHYYRWFPFANHR